MRHRTTRRFAAATFAVGAPLLGARDGADDVSQDPQGPAENAPGTEVPDAFPPRRSNDAASFVAFPPG